MPTIAVYREDRELTGKALSANTLASFLVAQGVVSISDLCRERTMSADLLRFLNRDRALEYWCEQGWLSRENGGYRLTREGYDEVSNREEGIAVNEQGRKKPGNVSPELVRMARQFIIEGTASNDCAIISQQFDIE